MSRFSPTRTGTFDILCFELCGVGHYAMRGSLVIETESEFVAWLGEQSTFAQSLALSKNGTDSLSNLVSREANAASVEKEPIQ